MILIAEPVKTTKFKFRAIHTTGKVGKASISLLFFKSKNLLKRHQHDVFTAFLFSSIGSITIYCFQSFNIGQM